ncbi:2-oxo-4-hydroxy-4-carboxy-5-ureidoimidazoline decarboxylase [Jannaschia sp. M317]|uniref:2-oxo-4-hydroxy-4-carboxy-5-ureidoimidazoline decarboxylase n=1 Tax=Jannaschia sp. M317 TaxID=2867011 RepID=UPI0021A3F187|nr:2-oxo-4-hydroxy-4-carboxy-5-ureidoimidazoline decarboxylase [Jannaschia sp. M317]UWQ17768.1 2-oxo-4-hydroxy-4-carboxy-5-ureidoimidazoline decarboxylase [Jannaschia sp. M317]
MQDRAPLSFSIDTLNRATDTQAAAMMDRIVERSAWLAHRAAAARPFRDAADLATWLETAVRALSHEDAVQLLCAHPELSPPHPTEMTQASQREQGRLRLLDPDTALATRLTDLNRRYLRRHGYPFVIALHAQTDLASVLTAFEQRLNADPEEELARALDEVASVMKARLAALTGGRSARAIPASAATIRGDDAP